MEHAMSYVKGFVFIVIGIFFLYSFGKKILKYKGTFSKSLIVGYVAYSASQALIGMTVQYFRIDYFYYKFAMITMVITICFFTFYRFNIEKNYRDYWIKFKAHIKKYRVIYILAAILLTLNLFNITYLWLGNHQDDGYYLLKVALTPFLGADYDVNYATGFNDTLALSRVVNTFELDYAFWSNILGIEVSVFCKAIISFFNYVLVLNAFNLLFNLIRKDEQDHASLWLSTILFFAIYPETLQNHGILNQQDAWHFNSAIWYGSGIVRSIGVIILIFPFVENTTINPKKIIWFLITSFALLSKASQALPLIYLAGVSLLLSYSVVKFKSNKKLLVTPVLMLIALLLVSRPTDLSEYMLIKTKEFFTTPILMISSLAFIAFPFVIKEKRLFVFQAVFGVMLLIMVMPNVNGLFLRFAMVDFVCGRTFTAFSFNLIIISSLISGMLLNKYIKRKVLTDSLFVIFGVACVSLNLFSLCLNFGISKPIQILANNTLLIPEESNDLSIELEKIALSSNKTLIAFGNGWLTVNGYPHALDTLLRIKAPHIQSLSAVTRFSSMEQNSMYKNFKIDEVYVYDNYRKDPHDKGSIEAMKTVYESYPFDIFYDISPIVSEAFSQEFGFHQVSVIVGDESYYISVSEEIYQLIQ